MRPERITLHGHDVTYRMAGRGPVVVLLHGILGSSVTWDAVGDQLAARGHTVIAPDLLGHGSSAKPRGDYSLGAYASGVRDLLAALGHDRATFVGHSLGGGIAMQCAYQFPDRCERLVLVASGGLGREVSLALRAATLPGAGVVLPLAAPKALHGVGDRLTARLRALGPSIGPEVEELWAAARTLSDVESRRAFLATLRGIVDWSGQRVDATDRLYLAEAIPTMVVWGGRDRVIPVRHAEAVAEALPSARIEVFERAGHFPHRDEPRRCTTVLIDFIATTEPAVPDTAALGALLREGATAG